jgi:hypothetical protein
MGKNISKPEKKDPQVTQNTAKPTQEPPKPEKPVAPQQPEISAEQKAKKIVKKLLDNDVYRSKLEHNRDLLESFAAVLSDEQELERTYLQRDFLKTVELVCALTILTR